MLIVSSRRTRPNAAGVCFVWVCFYLCFDKPEPCGACDHALVALFCKRHDEQKSAVVRVDGRARSLTCDGEVYLGGSQGMVKCREVGDLQKDNKSMNGEMKPKSSQMSVEEW